MKSVPGRRDVRQIVFATLAVAFGGWTLFALAPLDGGTGARLGPATVPGVLAVALIIVGVMVLASAAGGIAVALPRRLPLRWRLAALAPLILSLALPLVAALPLLLKLAPDPHFVEAALVFVGRPVLAVVCLVVLACTASGVEAALPLSRPRRAALLAALILPFLLWEIGALMLQPDIIAQIDDLPVIASLADGFRELSFTAGPADILAIAGLRWTLVIALGVVVMGGGLRTGLASLLAGALVGMAGIDVATGAQRLFDVDVLKDEFPYGFELAVASIMILMVLCRVNPLPAYAAFVSAATVEEQFRRTMLLSQGDLLRHMTGRPVALMALVALSVIVVVLVWYRWPWRASDGPGTVRSGL